MGLRKIIFYIWQLKKDILITEKPPISGPTVTQFKMPSSNKKSGWLMGCGAFGVVMGAIAVVYWPVLFYGTIRRLMTLNPTSMSFEIWRDVPIPMYLECYMWNITNVDEIIAKKATKIKMVQMGPYTYRESHVRGSWGRWTTGSDSKTRNKNMQKKRDRNCTLVIFLLKRRFGEYFD
ncbi:CD36 family domain-containing protein [Phthorimaea operculella]|nr:CD36 family domain-containing protein [Phthorimaea operculella]